MRIDATECSQWLGDKIRAVAKAKKNVLRLVTISEADELRRMSGGLLPTSGGWFMMNKRQIVLYERAGGQHVIFAL